MAIIIKFLIIFLVFIFNTQTSFARSSSQEFVVLNDRCPVQQLKDKRWNKTKSSIKKNTKLKGKVILNKWIAFKHSKNIYRIPLACTHKSEKKQLTQKALPIKKGRLKSQMEYHALLGSFFWQDNILLSNKNKNFPFIIAQKGICPGIQIKKQISPLFSWSTDLCVLFVKGFIAQNSALITQNSPTHHSYINSMGGRGSIGLFWHPQSFSEGSLGVSIPLIFTKLSTSSLPDSLTTKSTFISPGIIFEARLQRGAFSIIPHIGTSPFLSKLIFGLNLSYRL